MDLFLGADIVQTGVGAVGEDFVYVRGGVDYSRGF